MTRPDIPSACLHLAVAILLIVVVCGCVSGVLRVIDSAVGVLR